MAAILILTKEQAERIKGNYGRYSALEPIPLPDGNFMLPEDCLSDPDLKDAWPRLQEAKDQEGTKEVRYLSQVKTIKAGEYYLDDITPAKEPEEMIPGDSGVVKALQSTTKIDLTNTKVFLKPIAIKPIAK